MKKIQSYLTLAIAVIAILGWFTTIITSRVGAKKDAETMQKDITEIKADVKALSTSQVDGSVEDGKVQTFIEQHMILHESLH